MKAIAKIDSFKFCWLAGSEIMIAYPISLILQSKN